MVNKIILFLTFCLAAGLSPLFSQSLDEGELKKRSFDSIEFTNYQGPHAYLNTREEILGIGRSLAAGVASSPRFALGNKYAVVRIYQPEDPRLSADILALLPDAGVDHIRNLNLIVAGYLETALKYPLPTALLLADFITRYNAFYRGNLEYVTQTYAVGVHAEVTAENVGLSTVFSQWAGRSRILIPLASTVARGDRGMVDADVISAPEVVQDLKEEPQGLEQLKELTNLKEEEIAREQEAIAQAEENLDKREQEIILRMEEGEKTPATATGEGTPGTPTGPEAPATGEPGKLGTETSPAAELAKIQEERQALEEKKEQVAQREENLQQARQDIAQTENKRLEEEKKTPAAAQTPAAAAAPAGPPPPDALAYLSITDNEGQFAQPVLLDAASGKVLQRSSLNTVRSRQMVSLGSSYLVVAGRSEGAGTVKLFTLAQDSLKTLLESKVEAAPQSRLLVSGSQFYGVYKDAQGLWKAGLFGPDLSVVATSEEEVLPGTLVELKGSQLILQGKNGAVLRLNSKTLKKEGDFRG